MSFFILIVFHKVFSLSLYLTDSPELFFVINLSVAIILNLYLIVILESDWKYVGTDIDFIPILKLSIFAIWVFTAIHPGTPHDTFINSSLLTFISSVISWEFLSSSITKNSSQLTCVLDFSDNL